MFYYTGYGKRIRCSNESLTKVLSQNETFVTAIYVFHSDIRQLGKDQFSRYVKSLVDLTLQTCKISDIDTDAFRGLTSLEKLNLASNNISQVKGNWFNDLMSLQQLDLSYNQITSIDPFSFQRLSKLQRLELNGNQLTCLERNVLQPLRGLDKFHFEDNPLTLDCRAKLTLWLRDHGINYHNDQRGPEVWLDRILWLCAMDDSVPLGNKEEQMVECVVLNLFNQLRTVWLSPVSQSLSQQCTQSRKDLTRCLTTRGHRTLTNSTTNGAFVRSLLLQLRDSKSSS